MFKLFFLIESLENFKKPFPNELKHGKHNILKHSI